MKFDDSLEEFIGKLEKWFGVKRADAFRFLLDYWQNFYNQEEQVINDVWKELEKKLDDYIDQSLKNGNGTKEAFPLETLQLFCKLPRPELKEIKYGSLTIDPSSLDKEESTRLFNRLGIISGYDNKIILGYPVFFSEEMDNSYFVPTFLPEIFPHLAVPFVRERHRNIFLREVNEAQGTMYQEEDTELPAGHLEELVEALDTIYEISITISEHYKQFFHKLQKPSGFYAGLQPFYTFSSKSVYVFSQTSGLVIMEEYEGSDSLKKNQYRREYFDYLKSSSIKIYYQLDPNTTGEGLFKSEWDKEDSIRHFAGFLQKPNIEITTSDFQKANWKRNYTLISPKCGIAFSQRKGYIKKINTGIIANQMESVQTAFNTVEEFYENEEKDIVKPMGKILSEREAMEIAKERVNQWWELGQKQLKP